jgi:hypothetical protein
VSALLGAFWRAETWDNIDVPEPPVIRESDGTTRQGKTVVAGKDWHREVANEELTWVRIDHQTRLQFGDVEVVIESPFVVTLDSIDYPLDPEDRGGLEPRDTALHAHHSGRSGCLLLPGYEPIPIPPEGVLESPGAWMTLPNSTLAPRPSTPQDANRPSDPTQHHAANASPDSPGNASTAGKLTGTGPMPHARIAATVVATAETTPSPSAFVHAIAAA